MCFLIDYDETEYLVLFGFEKYNAIYDKSRYLKRLKSSITYAFFLKSRKKKNVLDDDLPLEETFILRKVTILITLVFDENKNHYYYNTFSKSVNHSDITILLSLLKRLTIIVLFMTLTNLKHLIC